MTGRYAIYFAPPSGSALEAFGQRFLGRDHITGREIERLLIDGLAEDDRLRMTASARHYGFHATLKAPFVLQEGCKEDVLHEALTNFAASRASFKAPPLQITGLSRWIAFTLSGRSVEMDELAADCVRVFEPFRAPLSAADIAKRRQRHLTPRQDQHLLDYGYPYILEDFHFHMTLAGPLEPKQCEPLIKTLRAKASNLTASPLPIDAIALYQQPDRETPFIQTAQFPFGAG